MGGGKGGFKINMGGGNMGGGIEDIFGGKPLLT